MLVASDEKHDPQALIFAPENIIKISKAVVNESDYYLKTKAAVVQSFQIINNAYRHKQVKIEESEVPWIMILEETLENLPDDESHFIESVLPTIDESKYIPTEYGL